MIYKVYLKQDGGCDYTIGCGRKLITIEASDIGDAQQQLFEIIKNEYSYDETFLESCEIFEVNNVMKIELDEWYKKIKDEENAIANKKREAKEYTEYLKLKSKFGD